MNVLKNYSNSSFNQHSFELMWRVIFFSLLLSVCFEVSAAEQVATTLPISAYLKVLSGLIFVVGLFLACSFLFKKYGNGPMTGRGQIRLVDGLHLGNRERLVLIELNGKQMLLSIASGQINKLETIDFPKIEDTANA